MKDASKSTGEVLAGTGLCRYHGRVERTAPGAALSLLFLAFSACSVGGHENAPANRRVYAPNTSSNDQAPGRFAITQLDASVTIASPIISWSAASGAASYVLALASSADCDFSRQTPLFLTTVKVKESPSTSPASPTSSTSPTLASTPSALVGPLSDGGYFVCLSAVGASGKTTKAMNNGLAFTVHAASPAGGDFSLLLPGGKSGVYYGNSPSFSWGALDSGWTYSVALSSSGPGCDKTVETASSLTASSWRPKAPLPDGLYYVCLLATNSSGERRSAGNSGSSFVINTKPASLTTSENSPSFSYPTIDVGMAQWHTLSITNAPGGMPAFNLGLYTYGNFTLDATTCASVLRPGESCLATVTASAPSSGHYAGALVVYYSTTGLPAPDSSLTLSLSADYRATWTWVGGAKNGAQAGVYGTMGVASPGNWPGARWYANTARDKNGTVWLFGGLGVDAAGNSGELNDLWKFDGQNWTWVSGSQLAGQAGVYGSPLTPDAANVPGARLSASLWADSAGNIWLFGGSGEDALGAATELSDLWKFDGQNWSWQGGGNTANLQGVYGTKGVASAANMPGARDSFASLQDKNGNVFIFSGGGFDSLGSWDNLSDLWKFDGSFWTWVGGSSTVLSASSFGSKGTASASSSPGARQAPASWLGQDGSLWFFGGLLYGTSSTFGDLWKFDGQNWSWEAGGTSLNSAGSYATQGSPSVANAPGGRYGAVSWTSAAAGSGSVGAASLGSSGSDVTGQTLWLFGGKGQDGAGTTGLLGDLWNFDGQNWTWVGGSNSVGQTGTYGERGVASSANFPGARFGAVSWVDAIGHVFILGGKGVDSGGQTTLLNDLWMYSP